MTDEPKMIRHYTSEMVNLAMKIWMRSSVSLIDIRNKTVERSKPIKDYVLPGNMFLYTHGASVGITLNQEFFQTSHYSLCHAGKGTMLSVMPYDDHAATFMILYKVDPIPLHKRNLQSLMKGFNPFTQQFGFTPTNPLIVMEKIQSMLTYWNKEECVDQFEAQVLFYQMVHYIYKELRRGDVAYMEPDYVAWVKQYLDRHFKEQVSIQTLADMLPLSRSLLGRLFRRRENSSLQEYLIRKRIEAAKTYLETTQASIQEIACGCGFTDEFNMIRLFKKYMKLSPGEYRRKRSMECINMDIDNHYHQLYNEKGPTGLVKSQRDGEFIMFGQARSKEMIVAAAMSLLLLLSACSAGTGGNNGGGANPTPAQTQQVQQPSNSDSKGTDAVVQTRTIATVKGDVEVPLNPERVIVDYLIGDVIALGVTPLAVAKGDEGGDGTAFANEIKESAKIESWEMEPEEVMALEPDLIILSFGEGAYEHLSKIAPTIYVPYGSMTTEERLRLIGNALNKSGEAEAALKAYEDKLAEARRKLQDAGLADATVTIGQFGADGNYVAGAKHAAGVVAYKELGLKAPVKVQTDIIDKDEYWGNLSMEVLKDYCGDFIISLGDVPFAANENAIWESIPAVQNEQIFSVDTAITWYTDLMSSMALVDLIVGQLLELSDK